MIQARSVCWNSRKEKVNANWTFMTRREIKFRHSDWACSKNSLVNSYPFCSPTKRLHQTTAPKGKQFNMTLISLVIIWDVYFSQCRQRKEDLSGKTKELLCSANLKGLEYKEKAWEIKEQTEITSASTDWDFNFLYCELGNRRTESLGKAEGLVLQ